MMGVIVVAAPLFALLIYLACTESSVVPAAPVPQAAQETREKPILLDTCTLEWNGMAMVPNCPDKKPPRVPKAGE
ncbi:MAG: hypothetical protein ABIW76_14380 [Fibrobacteria bacterium]